jgi:hypothetical protein
MFLDVDRAITQSFVASREYYEDLRQVIALKAP